MSCILHYFPLAPLLSSSHSHCCSSALHQSILPSSKTMVSFSLLSPVRANYSILPPPTVASDQPSEQGFSAKERRKQRNERREQLKTSKISWSDEIEEKMLTTQKKKRQGLRYETDLNRLAAKGLQWWMVFVRKIGELELAENLARAYSQNFPDYEFEVFVPIVPSKRRLKDGRYSDSKLRLHPGCIFLRSVMDRQVYDAVRKVPGVRGFFGAKVGHLVKILVPTPIPVGEIEKMLQKIKDEEEDIERLKSLLKEEKKARREIQVVATKEVLPDVGANVKVISGPHTNFEGHVVEVHSEDGKVKVLLTIFGQQTVVELSLDQVEPQFIVGKIAV